MQKEIQVRDEVSHLRALPPGTTRARALLSLSESSWLSACLSWTGMAEQGHHAQRAFSATQPDPCPNRPIPLFSAPSSAFRLVSWGPTQAPKFQQRKQYCPPGESQEGPCFSVG